jgi:hypothetical protein
VRANRDFDRTKRCCRGIKGRVKAKKVASTKNARTFFIDQWRSGQLPAAGSRIADAT